MAIRKEIRTKRSVLVIDIPYRDRDGKQRRYRRDSQVQTQAAARAEERRLLAQLAEHGCILVPSPAAETSLTAKVASSEEVTFAEATQRYRSSFAPRLKPSTRRGYEEILTGDHLVSLRSMPLSEFGVPVLSALDTKLVRAGASASRRRNVLVAVRTVFKAALESGLISKLPEYPKLVRVGRTVIEPFPHDRLDELLAKAAPSARLAFALSAYAGLRAGEIRGLRWGDMDLRDGHLVIRRAISNGVEASPKSGHQRLIPLAPPLLTLLGQVRPGAASEPVAPTGRGVVWGQTGLIQAIRRVCKSLGLKAYRFHALRHHFVTELFRQGVSAPTVQKLAGHADLSVTQRYAHVGAQDLRAAVATLRGNSVETGGKEAPAKS